MQIKVFFFASLRETAKTKELELAVPDGTTILRLKEILDDRIPGLLLSQRTALAAVNKEFALAEEEIPPGAEVAFFPPVSGGGYPTIYAITEAELDLDALLAQITLPTTGAACIFTGMVRGVTSRGDAHETVYLEYEAYVPMAEAKLRQVAEEIREKWPAVEGIAIIQRVGILYPKTPTVLIACTAAHRDTGVFDAARYGIDRLKEIVPVWKKEVGPGGEAWIEGDYIPKPGE